MSENMMFGDHIREAKNKAKKIAGWILRIVQSRSAETILLLFKVYVRPHLEYSCSLWSPYLIKHICEIEAVQRSMTARIEGLEELNYWERLKELHLYSLQRRRERYDIIHMWKIQNNVIQNDLELSFYHTPRHGWKCRRRKIQTRQGQLSTISSNSFSVRAAALYNTVPKIVKESNSLAIFKSRLDNYLKHIPDLPPTPNYVSCNKNSILDWASCSWPGKWEVQRKYSSMMTTHSDEPADSGEEFNAT